MCIGEYRPARPKLDQVSRLKARSFANSPALAWHRIRKINDPKRSPGNRSGSDIAALIKSIHSGLTALTKPRQLEADAQPRPAISVRRSVTPNHLVCLECGQRLLAIKRHLGNVHRLSPGQYRTKWNLLSDYPMTAPNYSKLRSEIAKEHGLGPDKGPPR